MKSRKRKKNKSNSDQPSLSDSDSILEVLPAELSLQIMSMLSIPDLMAFSLCNKILWQIGNDDSLWKFFLMKYFPDEASEIISKKNAANTSNNKIFHHVSNLWKADESNLRQEFSGLAKPFTAVEKFKKLFNLLLYLDYQLDVNRERNFAAYSEIDEIISSITFREFKTLLPLLSFARTNDMQYFLDMAFRQYKSLIENKRLPTDATNIFHMAVICKQEIWLRRLAIRPWRINFLDEEGTTPLQLACDLGFDQIVDALLNLGANPMINRNMTIDRRSSLQTPLHIAAENGNGKIVKRLCLDVKVKSRIDDPLYFYWYKEGERSTSLHKGLNALLLAARSNCTEAIQALLESGAHPNAKGDFRLGKGIRSTKVIRWTALHFAAAAGNEEMITLLLAHLANANVRSGCNRTPLDLAAENNHVGSLMLLLSFLPYPQMDSSMLRYDDEQKHLSCEYYFRLGMQNYNPTYYPELKHTPFKFALLTSHSKSKLHHHFEKAHKRNPFYFSKRLVRTLFHDLDDESSEKFRTVLYDIYKQNLITILTQFPVQRFELSPDEQAKFSEYLNHLAIKESQKISTNSVTVDSKKLGS